ncbi:penicillin-insensitive murein endopeptidase [Oceanisphaera arctica]|uniref:Penicillin-insensitive murein endopeptidase n=1 Tax=Oceanisphaera arctica TaxID=641510 RepID=A0A2P5TR99_9GAMM|nr:penicillin-insensitive murein endopeptidase [Oceanisphaera arctica]PPL18307.1 penicillin-insensitive murein endopeptidase [Oceanisphaera arctica]GHA12037.1 penicillin-insensitive murein endopeptidase [Oceanisphaera arctica]
MVRWFGLGFGLWLWLPAMAWAQAIGGYAAGCQVNARALPASGPGFYVIRSARERFYGQPPLIDYLQTLGLKAQQSGLPPILVADIAMERGGPFASGHRSHQTGLDADIWLRPPPKHPSPHRLEGIRAVDMVDHRYYILSRHFRDQQRQLIALAAQDERVSRIFVHPLIKKAMCRAYGEAPWLGRLRPWFGHSSHFHVRLHCPKGDTLCEPQSQVPAGTGCGQELASWLNDKAGAITAGPRTPFRPLLPKSCVGWVR